MKKYILLAAMLAAPNIAFGDVEQGKLHNMNCTQAVEWFAAQIKSPPPNFTKKEWNEQMENGNAETVAISILSIVPGSPCFKYFDRKNPASGEADGEKR